ncbi:hypothetical protein [Photobacterium carnosum]|nr:hypothetical protein [Photobacterium carnosum]
MAVILKELIVNRDSVSWIRTHGVDHEGSALCSSTITIEAETVVE